MRGLEEKLQFVTSEKRDLDLLLNRVSTALPSLEMRKVVAEMMRTQADVHAAQRDKAGLTATVALAESSLRSHVSFAAGPGEETRTKGTRLQTEVGRSRDQLVGCEDAIVRGKKRLCSLEDELKSLELETQQRLDALNDTRKFVVERQSELDELVREVAALKAANAELQQELERVVPEKRQAEQELLDVKSRLVKRELAVPDYKLRPSVSRPALQAAFRDEPSVSAAGMI